MPLPQHHVSASVTDAIACLCLSQRYYSMPLPQHRVSASVTDTIACLCLSQRYYSMPLPQHHVSASATDTTACLCLSHRYYSMPLTQHHVPASVTDTIACLCLNIMSLPQCHTPSGLALRHPFPQIKRKYVVSQCLEFASTVKMPAGLDLSQGLAHTPRLAFWHPFFKF